MSDSQIWKQRRTQRVRLAIEDGAVYSGWGFGDCDRRREASGEVVFNTAMCGYQEAVTDPSYAGQILVMSAPMIGNYGVNAEDVESSAVQVAGFVVREVARRHSNCRASGDLSTWFAEAGVIGLEGIDTRALIRRLRISGAMRGVLSCDASQSDADLVARARRIPSMTGQNLARCVTVPGAEVFMEDRGVWGSIAAGGPLPGKAALRVLAIDCGGKRNIYRHLVERGCDVQLAPCNVTAEEIREFRPDGLFISNGPGDPEAVEDTIATLREVGEDFPMFGICLGHQLLALAFGAKTFKLKYGHRGANQPVRNVITGSVEITSQNHGFCVDRATLPGDLETTHIHLNDNTLAGFRHRRLPVFAVQYHPEASPGPHDSSYLFDSFVGMMRTRKPVEFEPRARREAACSG